jgi:hypothetical protein
MPVVVTLLGILCYATHVGGCVPRLSLGLRIVSLFQITLAYVMFTVSYFNAVCRDPGYLPFNWSLTCRTKYSWHELLDGTATEEDQFAFVRVARRPRGCSFSSSAGRFVIRADHVCGWIANWVGKRNHKFFLLFQCWTIVFLASLLAWKWVPRSSASGVWPALIVITALVEAAALLYLLVTTGTAVKDLLRGRTYLQQLKGMEGHQIRTVDACRQICGDTPIACWPFSMAPPFPDDIELKD